MTLAVAEVVSPNKPNQSPPPSSRPPVPPPPPLGCPHQARSGSIYSTMRQWCHPDCSSRLPGICSRLPHTNAMSQTAANGNHYEVNLQPNRSLHTHILCHQHIHPFIIIAGSQLGTPNLLTGNHDIGNHGIQGTEWAEVMLTLRVTPTSSPQVYHSRTPLPNRIPWTISVTFLKLLRDMPVIRDDSLCGFPRSFSYTSDHNSNIHRHLIIQVRNYQLPEKFSVFNRWLRAFAW